MANNDEFYKRAEQKDPYKDFRFKLKWGDTYVAGVSKAIGLDRTTADPTHRSGSNPTTNRSIAGQGNYAPIKLQRGVSYDVAFEQWANNIGDYVNSSADDQQSKTRAKIVLQKDFHKDIVLEAYNEAGQLVLAYKLYNCWPSELITIPEMDGKVMVIQSLTLENEGWERDTSVKEQIEHSLTLPDS